METECIQESVCLSDFVQWLGGSIKADNPLKKYDRSMFSCYLDYKYMQEIFTAKPELLKEICWESVGLNGRDGAESTLWLGSEGAYTNCHYDAYGYNLVAQIYGRKRWVLFAPSDTQYLYPTRVPYEESSIFSQVDIKSPGLEAHPKIKMTNVYEVILEPGQILYVPRHWWHYVECLEPAISVNTWVELEIDRESRFEEAVTRSLFSSLWSSSIDMERQEDCRTQRADTIPIGETSPRHWINPKEEIWDITQNSIVLNEAYKALRKSNYSGLPPRSDHGCDKITSDTTCRTNSNNQHKERNLEMFATHFRGKMVHFTNQQHLNVSLKKSCIRCPDLNQEQCCKKHVNMAMVKSVVSSIKEEGCNNHSVTSAKILTKENRIATTSTYQSNNSSDINSANTYLKRKHGDEIYSMDFSPVKVSKSTPVSCEQLVDDSVLMETLSSQNTKCNSYNKTVREPCKIKSDFRCCDQDGDGQMCPSTSQSDVTITAVTAQPFMTWYSMKISGDRKSERDIVESMSGSFSKSSQELLGNSLVERTSLRANCTCNESDVNSEVFCDKQETSKLYGCDSDTVCESSVLKNESGETVSYQNMLTFEKFVKCATHPDVIDTIIKVIKNSMEND